MHLKLRSVADLLCHVEQQGDLCGVAVYELDLCHVDQTIKAVSSNNAVYLGCRLTITERQHIESTGGLILPRLPDLPFLPYRSKLYTSDELMAGYRMGQPDSREDTVDGQIWAWYRSRHDKLGARLSMADAIAQRLHDHAMDNALVDLLSTDPADRGSARRVVAIMGGHALARTDTAYADVVRLGRLLAQDGMLVASGGGPGAMEAAHVGAWLRDQDGTALTQALSMLSPAPHFRDAGWVETAVDVRQRWPSGSQVDSLAIPTWFYGHEPTNLFATHVAKYFSNSLREDGLLAIATSGVIYAPGSAGTLQEVFMDAAQNHYGTFDVVSPMVFLGRDYWTQQRPVRPLLEKLAENRQYRPLLAFVDTPAEAAAFIASHPPIDYKG
ncbi:MAG: hypothetical protein GXP62_12745 [Oligoflexia bacterium]|nr:hypothetical protein [Oligoflexia bacterium]